MTSVKRTKKYFVVSCLCHLGVLLLFIIGFESVNPLVVIENTNKHDVISAVILGDIKESKILPQETPKPVIPKPMPEPVKEKPKPLEKVVKPAPAPPKPDAISLRKKADKLKEKKAIEEKLLAEMKPKKIKKKQIQRKEQAALKAQFEKTLREQISLDDLKMKGTQSRQASGVVKKYQALIIQAISEHWIVPPTANKKLSSLLIIKLSPSGSVLDVQIAKSSGDPALDSSARAAVFKASPLPVPKKSEDFEPFKHFSLKVRPETVLSGDGGMTG